MEKSKKNVIVAIAFFLLIMATICIVAAVLFSQPEKTPSLRDSEIRKILIQRSISNYSGNCPCPYSRDSAGNRCGGRSAWSRPGGADPLCYDSDVTNELIEGYRERDRK